MKKNTIKGKSARGRKDPNVYPKGWDKERVQKLIQHYDTQTDDEAIAEAEAAYESKTTTMMQVPNDLVPKVRKLISKRAG